MARPGEAELEIEPLGYLREGPDRFLISPAVVANFGIADERELVFEGKIREARDASSEVPAASLVDAGLSMKQVLRQGSCQDKTGPSIAAEYGLLLPAIHAESGTGVSLIGIVSQRWRAGTIHLNGALILNREHRADTFWGVIGEGPCAWSVRPVAEVFVQNEAVGPRTVSALAGAIWRFREDLSVDVGFREARIDNERVREWRLGFTWGFPYEK